MTNRPLGGAVSPSQSCCLFFFKAIRRRSTNQRIWTNDDQARTVGLSGWRSMFNHVVLALLPWALPRKRMGGSCGPCGRHCMHLVLPP